MILDDAYYFEKIVYKTNSMLTTSRGMDLQTHAVFLKQDNGKVIYNSISFPFATDNIHFKKHAGSLPRAQLV